MAKVSIVTSVYNKAPWLDRFFQSVINQSYSDIEILVINNASTDESASIIDKYKKIDSRIRVITLNNNIGPGGGFGLGINKVTSEYFTICDSDDYIESNYIEVLLKKIIENGADLSMCTNDMVWHDGTVRINNRPGKDIIFTSKDSPQMLPQLLDHHSDKYLGYYLAELGVVWGKLYKTSFIRKNNLNYSTDEWVYCDWLFNFKVYKSFRKMVYTEDTVYHYYQDDNSVTNNKKMNWNKISQIKTILSKFDFVASDVMTKPLNKALTRFKCNNILALVGMYLTYYPDIVKKTDLKAMIREVSGWSVVKKIHFFDQNGLGIASKCKMQLIKYRIVFPFIIKRFLKG